MKQAAYLAKQAKKLHKAAKSSHHSHFFSFFHSLSKKIKAAGHKAEADAKKFARKAKSLVKSHHLNLKHFEKKLKAGAHTLSSKAKGVWGGVGWVGAVC